MADDISEDLRQFLSTHIASIVQLELLFLLRSTAPRPWSAEEIASELRIDAAWAQVQANALCNSGLLNCDRSGQPQFTYQPREPTLDLLVERAAKLYAERRVTMITFLYSRPSDHVKALAEAFRFRKGGPHG